MAQGSMHPMKRVYLDSLSTTPLLPEAVSAMIPFLSEHFASASARHGYGQKVRRALDTAREQIAAWIGATNEDGIIFTSSGTEAVNLGIFGTANAPRRRGKQIVTSNSEHPAVFEPLRVLEEGGFEIRRVAVDGLGFIDPSRLAEAITDETILVCTHWASHDLGTIQAVQQLSDLTRELGVPLLLDATAANGWTSIDLRQTPVDLLALSPHRCYGPKGVGVLYKSSQARLSPIILGGSQEHGKRAGTENVPAIVAAGVVAEILQSKQSLWQENARYLQTELWNQMSVTEATHLNGPRPGPGRLPHHLNISAAGVEGEGLMLALDMRGFQVAAGTGCILKSSRISPALEAIGLRRDLALAAILIGLGMDSTLADATAFGKSFQEVVAKFRSIGSVENG